MKVLNIILGIVGVLAVYMVYRYFFVDNRDKVIVHYKDAKVQQSVSSGTLPAGASINFTYSLWFYVNDWNYRYGEEKVIFEHLTSEKEPVPLVYFDKNTNNLNVTMTTYNPDGDATGSNTSQSTCYIENVPLQKWTNLIITLNGRALDLYLDGKLVRTCVLPGVPKTSDNDILVTPTGGYSGYISYFRYLTYAVNPTQAYNIYKEGYGGSSLGGLLDKYRVKIAFLEDNKEVNSFEL